MSSELKVGLVTGGAKRVGKGVSEALHRAGFNVVIHCNSSLTDAQSLCEQFNRQREDSAVVIAKDLSRDIVETAKGLVEDSEARWGRIDLVVNNASNFNSNHLNDFTGDEFDSSINVNLKAPVFIMQAAAKSLRATKGSIVNLLDLVGVKPKATHFTHSVSKSALMSATQNAALALAPEVRVNGIAPGCVAWPEVDPKLFDSEEKKKWLSTTPLKKIGTPEDVGNAVVFLASPEANFITGQILTLDGGRG